MTEQEAIKILKVNAAISASQTEFCEAVEVAAVALEEAQQYREIERELKEQYQANIDIKMLIRYFIETIFKGEKHERFCILTNEDADKWDAYKAIGTAEEYKELAEKQIPKKPVEYEDKYYGCPACGNILLYKWEKYPTKLKSKTDGLPYCLGCGQAIDWSEN